MSYTVGQLARLTGLTVRALHHYHAIGLLVPSQRSESGYRLYTQTDIVRLYRIQALQRLNLSLNEVAAALAKDGAPLPQMIGQQLDELDDRIEKATALRARLTQIREVLTRGDEPVAGDWLAAVELITQYDQYCSSDELQRLLANSNTDKDQWRALLSELRAAQERDVPVQSDHVQELADRWMRLMLARVGGDFGLAIKMKMAYHAQPDLQARMQAQSGLDASTMEYLTRAARHGNLAAWARHLEPPALERLNMPDERMREWLRVAGEMRSAMAAGDGVDGCAVQALVGEWESLLEEFSGGDAAVRDRMEQALHADTLLQRRWALDASLLEFVQRARNVWHSAGAAHGRA
ncbi:MAG TPA: MerR family transcriptional regulator [Steroidobacteraceae bacterium]|nr:MerR family transcriptional regulator [Steroidobacteraceae bacterium]